jgi:endonuclease/exonuclease/phosphatase family metal-dependent hydrolase
MMTLRVASLNVCGLPSRLASPKLAPLPERATWFGGELEASDVDVVVFQEVWTRRALDVLTRSLPSFRYAAWHRGLRGQPAGGLVTFARRPLGTVGYTCLRGAMPTQGGPVFRAMCAINSSLQGVLIVDIPELGVAVASTHLTANHDGDWSATNRHHGFQHAQLRLLQSAVARRRANVTILGGDFNIASDSPLYRHIVDGDRWQDPFAPDEDATCEDATCETAIYETATYDAAFLPEGATQHRIDYLLTDGVVLGSSLLFAEPYSNGGYASDHIGLSVRVRLS